MFKNLYFLSYKLYFTLSKWNTKFSFLDLFWEKYVNSLTICGRRNFKDPFKILDMKFILILNCRFYISCKIFCFALLCLEAQPILRIWILFFYLYVFNYYFLNVLWKDNELFYIQTNISFIDNAIILLFYKKLRNFKIQYYLLINLSIVEKISNKVYKCFQNCIVLLYNISNQSSDIKMEELLKWNFS